MVRDDVLMTAEELLELQPPNMRSELVCGRMYVREPAAYRHGKVSSAIGAALYAWVSTRALGDTVGAETGFILRRAPDTVRAPDAAFISNARVPSPDPVGYAELAPDLVVEVRSPSDRAGKLRAKIADWLTAGARLVWVIDPVRRCAEVHRVDGSTTHLTNADVLGGEDVLPGFTLSLQQLFDT